MNTVDADGRDLLQLLRDLLRPDPAPEKLDLYWTDQKDGGAPDQNLIIMLQAARQDGLSEDGTENIGLEAGDGSPDTLSNMVFMIPGGLGLIIATRRHEHDEREIAAWLEDELDLEEGTVECHKNRKRMQAIRSKFTEHSAPDLAN